MPKATAVFDSDDSRLSGALARINGKMLALQSRIAKFAVAFIAIRAAAGVMTAGLDRFKQALDVGGQLNDLSANTGIAIVASGWQGPVGILNHTDADAEARLRDNLEGLRWLLPQLKGEPAGPKPVPTS